MGDAVANRLGGLAACFLVLLFPFFFVFFCALSSWRRLALPTALLPASVLTPAVRLWQNVVGSRPLSSSQAKPKMYTAAEGAQGDLSQLPLQALRRLGCSEETALRLAIRCGPDVEGCVQELQRRRRPSLIALDVSCRQGEYLGKVCRSMKPVEKTRLPCFRREHLDEPSSGYPALTWGAVATRINLGPDVEIFFLDVAAEVRSNRDLYESYYQKQILADGYADILAFTTIVDGLVPLVDYLHARHFGGMQPHRPSVPRGLSAVGGDWHGIIIESLARGGGDTTRGARSGPNALQSPPRRTRILLGNDPRTSVTQRQDKAGMQLALKAHGLTHIRGSAGFSAADAKRWKQQHGIPFPVVIKPVSGAGSELVTVCYTDEEIDVAFALTCGVKTTQMTEASHMVLQEYIEGPEYVVNVVSYEGKHVVSDVWQSWKYPLTLYSTRLLYSVEERLMAEFKATGRGRLPARHNSTAIMYDRIEFVHNLAELDAESEVRRVVAYTLQCLDALGMRQGCSHCELRVDSRPDSGTRGMPFLIELNPRVLGDTPRSTPLVGYDQYTLLAYLLFAAAAVPEAKPPLIQAGKSYAGEKNAEDVQGQLPWPPAPLLYTSLTTDVSCHVIFLRVEESSVVCNIGLRQIIALPTFGYFTRGSHFDELGCPGTLTLVSKTVDLFTSPLACVLNGAEADLRRDAAYIRRVENKDLSALTPLLNAALKLQPASQRTSITHATSCPLTEAPGRAGVAANKKAVSHANNTSEFDAAVDAIVSFFAQPEPPLFVPLGYFLDLRVLRLEHLILGARSTA
ncbi:Phosphoribosylamine--glycine ligase [Trypanosoma conorhini]|uniref:Phosphoribosylamine--glycine ligase n=1 Tax=Trypanosoma conorhini TaxID=83891 RepID=A0A422PK98_9TRYP|nr:Phosphoribosylamine--glycine ligase [Trypanosoma conorhini]RNF18138.1 Phosphoribosylamine--glycine ligase [Trypanosoma conorhini]